MCKRVVTLHTGSQRDWLPPPFGGHILVTWGFLVGPISQRLHCLSACYNGEQASITQTYGGVHKPPLKHHTKIIQLSSQMRTVRICRFKFASRWMWTRSKSSREAATRALSLFRVHVKHDPGCLCLLEEWPRCQLHLELRKELEKKKKRKKNTKKLIPSLHVESQGDF